MRILEYNLPAKHKITMAGDQHIGAASCNQDIIKAYVKRVKGQKNHFLGLMGDMGEAIELRDKRFTLDEHAGMTPVDQYDLATELHRPVASNILWNLEGNHDYKLIQHGTGSFVRKMCKDLGVPQAYADYSSVIKINIPDDGVSYKIFAWHGAGHTQSNAKDPEQRMANIKAAITRKLASQMSDTHVMAMGHIHKLMAYRPPAESSLYTDDNKILLERGHRDQPMDVREYQNMKFIPEPARWYSVTGTAKRSKMMGYSTWEERMGFGASDLGWAELNYDNGRLWVETKFWGEVVGE